MTGLSAEEVQKHIDHWDLLHLPEARPVVNLSQFPLNDSQITVLSMGSKFSIPSNLYDDKNHSSNFENFNNNSNTSNLKHTSDPTLPPNEPFENLAKRILWAIFPDFDISKAQTPFLPKSGAFPPSDNTPRFITNTLRSLRTNLQSIKPIYSPIHHIPKSWIKAIKDLQSMINNRLIIIKPCDKGSSLVVLSTKAYLQEGYNQLNDPTYYKKLYLHDSLHNEDFEIDCYQSLLWFQQNKYLSERQLNFIFPKNDCRTRLFYLLPKIHKDPSKWTIPGLMPPGRPIVSDINSETYQIARYIDHLITPICNIHPSYTKDTQHLLDKLKNISLPKNCILASLDIKSLYTNIRHDDGISAIKKVLMKYYNFPQNHPFIQHICKLLELCLTNNTFQFNGDTYLQLSGVAMGHIYSPKFADIFMSCLEEIAIDKLPFPLYHYSRYLDDILLMFNPDEMTINQITEIFNSINPSIDFTNESSDQQINFLDVTLFKGDRFNESGILDTKVYSKPTDTRSLLHSHSFHPQHIFKGIVKSQITRYHRICSSSTDFKQEVKSLFKILRKRGYSNQMLNRTYSLWLSQKLNHPRGSHPCGLRHCICCSSNNLSETTKISPINELKSDTPPSITSKPIRLPSSANCKTQGIIYLIQCNECGQGYVGHSTKDLSTRFKQHIYLQDLINRRLQSNQHNRTRLLYLHFLDCGDITKAKLTILDTLDRLISVPNTNDSSLPEAPSLPIRNDHIPNRRIDQTHFSSVLSDKQILLSKEAHWIALLGTSYKRGGLNTQAPKSPKFFPFIHLYCRNSSQFREVIHKSFRSLALSAPYIFGRGPLVSNRMHPSIRSLFCRAKHPPKK